MIFYLVTKFYVTLIDAKTGAKIKQLDKLVDTENGFEIIDFAFDKTHRKFYVGDT